jgi:hypothetical protein
MPVTTVAQLGSHLLVRDGDCYAVIERRNDQLFSCHDAARAGIPASDPSGITRILDAGDWTDRETAHATFDAITRRGAELAQRML